MRERRRPNQGSCTNCVTINKTSCTLVTVLLFLACAAASVGCTGTDAGGNGLAAPTPPEATASPREAPAQPSSDGLLGEEEVRSLAAAALEREIPGIRIERMAAEPYDVQTYGDVWRFRVKAEDDPDPRGDIQVWIDAADGEMVYFQDARDYYRSTAPQSRSMWRKRLPLRISGNEARVRMS